MIKKIFTLIPFAMLACGGQQPNIQDPDRPQICSIEIDSGAETCRDLTDEELIDLVDSQSVSDIGQLTQALTSDNGYGTESNSTECYVPWTGSRCLLPKDRTFKIVNNVCSAGTTGACQAALEAEQDWRTALNAQGFIVTFVNDGTAGQDTVVRGGVVGTVTDGVLGLASLYYNTGEQVAGPGGNYQRVFDCDVTMDFLEIEGALVSNRTIYPTPPTQAQRNNAYYNATMHELGHCAALGHHTSGIMKSAWPDMFSRHIYDSFQNTWLNHYRAF